MSFNPSWNRRTFLASLGLTGAAATLPASASAGREPAAKPGPLLSALAFVSTASGRQSGAGEILPFSIQNGQWTPLASSQTVATPVTLAAHSTLPILYTGHEQAAGTQEPRGHVASVAFDRSGALRADREQAADRPWLQHSSLTPLALSSTAPRQMAVTHRGESLLVCDRRSGIVNVLSLAPDGSIRHLEHAHKQLGSVEQQRPRTPGVHSIITHPALDLAYLSNTGSDRVFALSLSGQQPENVSRLSLPAGSSPSHLALSPDGRLLFVSHRGGVTVVPLQDDGTLTSALHTHPLPATSAAVPSPAPLAISPRGDRLYALSAEPTHAGRPIISTLRIARSGRLSPLSQLHLPASATISASQNTSHLQLFDGHLVAATDGGIFTSRLGARTGAPEAATLSVPGIAATGLVLQRI